MRACERVCLVVRVERYVGRFILLHGRVEGVSARLDRLAARAEHVLRLSIVHRRSDVGILAAILSLEILVEDFNCAFVYLLVLVVLQRLDLAQAVRLLDEVRIPENK